MARWVVHLETCLGKEEAELLARDALGEAEALDAGEQLPKGEAEISAEEHVAEGEALVAIKDLSNVETELSERDALAEADALDTGEQLPKGEAELSAEEHNPKGFAVAEGEAVVALDGLSRQRGQDPLDKLGLQVNVHEVGGAHATTPQMSSRHAADKQNISAGQASVSRRNVAEVFMHGTTSEHAQKHAHTLQKEEDLLLAENSSQVKRLPTEEDTLLKSKQNFRQASRLLKGKQWLHATDFHNEEDKFPSKNWACR